MTRYPLFHLLVSLGLAVGAAACGGDDNGNNSPCGALEAQALTFVVVPPTINTGFNGRDTYQAAITTQFGIVDYQSSNDAVATVESVGCLGPNKFGVTGLVTAKSVGSANISVTSGEFNTTIPVNVKMYTTEEYDTGKQRYENAVDATPQGRSCASCHLGGGGAPHSPTALAGTSDADLILAATTSKYPDTCLNKTTDAVCNCTPVGIDDLTACNACPEGAAACAYTPGHVLTLAPLNQGEGVGDHVFTLTPAEQAGIMAYIRALEPEGI